MYMKTAVINFKVDPKLKAAAQARAKKLGVSLSMILNDTLKEFASGKPMSIDFPEEQMTPHMERLIAEIEAENEREGTVGPFTLEEAKAYLKSHHNDS
jgi:antitoxin component of RelBE/YafQ-DinJ toxin-antitoxin module